MEPLAYVEIVDRHGDVTARHAVHRWPVRVGRSYDADVIVDDPYIAPHHLTIEPAAEGAYAASSADTMNGLSVRPRNERVSAAAIGPDDLVRIGHTQLRVRPRDYTVAAERPMRAVALYRRPLVFVALAAVVLAVLLAAAVVLAVLLANGWVRTFDEDEKYTFIAPVLAFAAVIAIWISVWSFVSTAVGRMPNFAAHGSIACAGFLAAIALDGALEYLEFAFDQGWIGWASIPVAAAVLAFMLFRHLVLNSRARRGTLKLIAAGVSALVFGGALALTWLLDVDEGNQRYSGAIKPASVLVARGVTLDAFMNDAQTLKSKVDALNRKQ
jgi:hypothetical protein